MKKLVLLVIIKFLVVAGVLFPASEYKIEKNVIVAEGDVYPHSLLSSDGTVEIKGNVKGSVIMGWGKLILDGVVEEDVICVGSDVTIGKTALIKRDLFVIAGTLNKNEAAGVKGEFIFFEFDLKRFENTVIPVLSDSHAVSFLKAMKLVLWFIVALILFAIIPRKVYKAEEVLTDNFFRMAGIGVLSVLAFIFLGLIFLILSLVVIGIPLLILLVLAFIIVFVLGRTVLFYTIGLKFSNKLHYYHVPPAVYIMEGVIFYALLKFLPVVGPILLILINILEVGIGVGFIFRKRLKLKT